MLSDYFFVGDGNDSDLLMVMLEMFLGWIGF